jgi:mannose-1-phosphate guanylyltransferase/mannose-6-phosphate isomerase
LIHPVILSGGSGTRLWPLSRASWPKQFAKFSGARSLFQETALRFAGEGFAPPVVVTGSDFRFIVAEQLAEGGIDPGAILLEPSRRNTAPAVLAAALHAAQADPEARLIVVPSDAVIRDVAAFRAAVARGSGALDEGRLVTFGVTPDRPETGYGYLELAGLPDGSGAPIPLARFVEKPDAARAAGMLAAGTFLWNAGMFLFRAADMIAAFRAHAPDFPGPVGRALAGARADLGFLRLEPEAWAAAPDLSIDYAVMEKATNLSVVPFAGGWSDLGDWDAVWRETGPDAAGVVTAGRATALDCEDTLLRSEDGSVELVGLGLAGIVAVAMGDAVLVADKSRAQDVRKAVDALAARGARQAAIFPRDHRPWGWFESLATGSRFQVKRIHVRPGAALSLQSHMHRSEHWIVVEGTARITIDATVRLVSENESVYIPLGSRHRLENPGKLPMVLIEVQTGAYLGEDDITRYEDLYARD